MPGCTVRELARHARDLLGLAGVPITIVMTEGEEEKAREAGLLAGAGAGLTKPLSGVQAVDLVERLTAAPNGAGAGREG